MRYLRSLFRVGDPKFDTRFPRGTHRVLALSAPRVPSGPCVAVGARSAQHGAAVDTLNDKPLACEARGTHVVGRSCRSRRKVHPRPVEGAVILANGERDADGTNRSAPAAWPGHWW